MASLKDCVCSLSKIREISFPTHFKMRTKLVSNKTGSLLSETQKIIEKFEIREIFFFSFQNTMLPSWKQHLVKDSKVCPNGNILFFLVV